MDTNQNWVTKCLLFENNNINNNESLNSENNSKRIVVSPKKFIIYSGFLKIFFLGVFKIHQSTGKILKRTSLHQYFISTT